MHRIRLSAGLVFACGALAVLLGAPSTAYAQKDSDHSASSAVSKKVDLNLDNADIRLALKLLFQAAGVNYSIDPNVQGSVTVSLTKVSFLTALESLLKSAASEVKLTYRVEDNVYHVSPRQEPPPLPAQVGEPEPPEPKTSKITKINLNFIDAYDLAQVVGGTVIQTRFGVNAVLTGFGNGFGQGGFGQGQMGQGGFGQGQFGQGNFGNGGFGQFGNGGFGQFGNGGFGQFGNSGSGQFSNSGFSGNQFGNGNGNNGGPINRR